MQLESISYSEFINTENLWELNKIELANLNLIVGKNASGKSRSLRVINSLARLLTGMQSPFKSGNFDARFSDNGTEFTYKINNLDGEVIEEYFMSSDKIFLERSEGGIGKLWGEKAEAMIDFQAPTSQVAAFSRRDNIQHSYFEKLFNWANQVYLYEFGSDMGRSSISIKSSDIREKFDPKKTDQLVPFIVEAEKEIGPTYIAGIKSDMAKIGYDLMDVGLRSPSNLVVKGPVLKEDPINVFVRESGVPSPIDQVNMSQGMFRALSLISQLNYSIMSGVVGCFLIDDIGEGLDFERATALISLLRDKARNSNSQIIMTTNDRFVMNAVPLNYWSILYRTGSKVEISNYRNSQDKFDEFKYTGLNNFDFFATDFAKVDK